MSNDIRTILQKLKAVEEGKISPVSVKKGLTGQQQEVPQLPALFRPKDIKVLGAKKDPTHPMAGYAVGSNESRLAEAMVEIEEDMLSKVKKDLNAYLDALGQKTQLDRDLADKAKKDVEDLNPAKAGQQKDHESKDLDEDDYELEDPETQHDIENKIDTTLAQPQKPVQVMEIDSDHQFEIYESGNEYEIRHRGRSLPTRYRSADDAAMALDLFRAHRKQKLSSADYVEER